MGAAPSGLVSRIAAAGHEVGNHYFRKGSTPLHPDAQFVEYLEKTESAIGMTGRKLRPPGGLARPRQLGLARAKGKECVLGCAYPHNPMPTTKRLYFLTARPRSFLGGEEVYYRTLGRAK